MSGVEFASGREWRSIDSVQSTTPLGIRFWDSALDRAIRDGLRVEARPETGGRMSTALATPSGVYVFHNLPGMAARELGYVDHRSDVTTCRFEVYVADQLRRFLPMRFPVELSLPVENEDGEIEPYNGLLRLRPGHEDPNVMLFSSPARSTPPGIAAVRGRVIERDADPRAETPVRHALVEVILNGNEQGGVDPAPEANFGLTDGNGNFAVMFPYPAFEPPPDSDNSSAIPIAQQEWSVLVRVRHAANAEPSGETPGDPRNEEMPDLLALLEQPPVQLWNPVSGAFAAEREETLLFGRDLLVRPGEKSALEIESES